MFPPIKPFVVHLFLLQEFQDIERRGLGITPGYYEQDSQLLSTEHRRKIEPKETPSSLIPCLHVVFTLQLEILVTSTLEFSRGS